MLTRLGTLRGCSSHTWDSSGPLDWRTPPSRPRTPARQPRHKNAAVVVFGRPSSPSGRSVVSAMRRNMNTLKLKHQRRRNKSLATPTLSLRAARPADDVRISLVKLPAALSGKFALLKLQDVSRLHGNRPHLCPMPVLQRHGDVTPRDLDPLRQAHRSLAAGRLTRQQSFGVAGGQEACWR